MGLELNRGTCRTKDCKGYPKRQGYCVTCHGRIYHATSDGVRGVSRKPKLTVEQCKEIKRLSVGFKTNHEIAIVFGVREQLISKVLKGIYKPREVD